MRQEEDRNDSSPAHFHEAVNHVTQPPSMDRKWWHAAAAVALIVSATILAFGNSFQGVFLYDATQAIAENEHIRKLWPLSDAMSLPLIGEGYSISGRPVASFSLALNYWAFGPEPWGYHAVSLGIHICAALLLFGIVRQTMMLPRFTGPVGDHSLWLATAVALMWAVHPLQTASVTNLAQRPESLAGMLMLLTLYCALRGMITVRSGRWYGAAAVACLLGMGSKESMFAAPLIVLLYDYTFITGSFGSALRKRRCLYSLLAASWILLGTQIYFTQTRGEINDFTTYSPIAYALTQPGVILYYLRLSIWPARLVADYNWPFAESAGDVFFPGIVIAGLLAATAVGIYRRTWWGFAFACFFLALGPSSSFAALRQRIQEHRMYIPLAMVLVLTVAVLVMTVARFNTSRSGRRLARLIAVALVLCMTLAFGWQTHLRNRDYHSAEAFWSKNVRFRPASYVAAMNYGKVLLETGRAAEAVPLLRKAAAAPDAEPATYYDFGAALIVESASLRSQAESNSSNSSLRAELLANAERHLVEAVVQLETSVRLRPDYADGFSNLGLALWQLGRAKQAIKHFEKAVELGCELPTPYNILGAVATRQGNVDLAKSYYRQSLALKPTMATRQLLSSVFFLEGKTLFEADQTNEAVQKWQEAIDVYSDNADAHNALGVAYFDRGERQLAIRALQRALEIVPTHEHAKRNLEKIMGATRP